MKRVIFIFTILMMVTSATYAQPPRWNTYNYPGNELLEESPYKVYHFIDQHGNSFSYSTQGNGLITFHTSQGMFDYDRQFWFTLFKFALTTELSVGFYEGDKLIDFVKTDIQVIKQNRATAIIPDNKKGRQLTRKIIDHLKTKDGFIGFAIPLFGGCDNFIIIVPSNQDIVE